MWKVKVSGTYFTESQLGRELTDFDFEKEICSCPESWIQSVVKYRLVPVWIAEEIENEKNKTKDRRLYKRYDGIDTCQIVDWEPIDKQDGFLGKNIMEMDEAEIQEAAGAFVLLEVPLHRSLSRANIKTLRDDCALQYIKRVRKVPMNTEEDKLALPFYKKSPAGQWVVDFSDKPVIINSIVHPDEGEARRAPIVQKTMDEIMGELPTVEALEKPAPTEEQLLTGKDNS